MKNKNMLKHINATPRSIQYLPLPAGHTIGKPEPCCQLRFEPGVLESLRAKVRAGPIPAEREGPIRQVGVAAGRWTGCWQLRQASSPPASQRECQRHLAGTVLASLEKALADTAHANRFFLRSGGREYVNFALLKAIVLCGPVFRRYELAAMVGNYGTLLLRGPTRTWPSLLSLKKKKSPHPTVSALSLLRARAYLARSVLQHAGLDLSEQRLRLADRVASRQGKPHNIGEELILPAINEFQSRPSAGWSPPTTLPPHQLGFSAVRLSCNV
ncbi:unnamed protein product [Trichogramma brassicae]|uniref:Uncharacterized protein n=1 Tax=Trichogramma brassicae TaxID=86971 RepID=A0A6H5I896_9HYME|nr:unnamed protein product [Trichogramma brassicae]